MYIYLLLHGKIAYVYKFKDYNYYIEIVYKKEKKIVLYKFIKIVLNTFIKVRYGFILQKIYI